MMPEIEMGEKERFKGILIDTCANRSSVMSIKQYRAYCDEFKTPFHINSDDKVISGIGGQSKTIGNATIPIPFKELNLVIDVNFKIMKDNIPTLLSLKDMVDNQLDLSILKQEITI